MDQDNIINVQDIILLVNIILWESEPEDVCEDIDGNVYETVLIGEQLWMAENLKVTHYNNGDAITHIANEEHWGSMDEGQYDEAETDFAAAIKISPEGWIYTEKFLIYLHIFYFYCT